MSNHSACCCSKSPRDDGNGGGANWKTKMRKAPVRSSRPPYQHSKSLFYRSGWPSGRPTNSIKHWRQNQPVKWKSALIIWQDVATAVRMSIRTFSRMRWWQVKHCFMRGLHCEQATWCPHGRNVIAIGSVVHIMHRLPRPAWVDNCCGFGAIAGFGLDLLANQHQPPRDGIHRHIIFLLD